MQVPCRALLFRERWQSWVLIPRLALHQQALSYLAGILITSLVAGCGGSVNGGSSTSSPTPPAPYLKLALSPGSPVIYDSTTFTITITASDNQQGTPTVTLGQLPSGLSTAATFPLSIPSAGAQITFVASNTLAPGSYAVQLNGTAGSATDAVTLTVTIESGTPPNFVLRAQPYNPPFLPEVAVAAGGTGQVQFTSATSNNLPATYNVELSVSGLPPGVTATVSPSVIIPGQNATVTLSAAMDAPLAQNTTVALNGVPDAPVLRSSADFLADVTGVGGALPNNRTDYLSTEGTPNSAVYDAAHNLVFSSNPSWNRIDVISNTSHRILKSIPVPNPQSVDLSQDRTRVWIGTGSQLVFSIDTTTFAATRFLLPNYAPYSNLSNTTWKAQSVFALSDGSLFLIVVPAALQGSEYAVVWNPASNSLTPVPAPTGAEGPARWETVIRSGDGSRVYSIGSDSSGDSFYYDLATKTVSSPRYLSGYAGTAAVNFNGSQIAVADPSGLNLYDGDFNLIGALPGGGFGPPLYGGLLFSPDNSTLYEECMPLSTPLIISVDTAMRTIRGIAPAMPMTPVMVTMVPPFYIPTPFAVDSTGMLLGRDDWGIAFDDATYYQNFSTVQAGTPTFMQHMSPYSGPLAGGTVSSGFGNGVSMDPNVWYGSRAGVATDSSGTLSITSPPGAAPGPVNLKLLFPDGIEVFDPLFFSYGPDPQYATFSGGPPTGGVPAQISGYGLPTDSGGGTVLVGGNMAVITTKQTQYLPLTGAPFPSTFLNFTAPSGAPGWSDVEVDTPNGNAVLPHAFFYAQSVTDYPSSDSFTNILYDAKRQQLYLSAQDHIDVFSLTSNEFLTPLTPPAQGSRKQFAGMALTPDGSLLLAAGLLDGSLAVIDPDNPSTAYEIPIIAAPTAPLGSCNIGPLYVAAAVNQQAFVVTGGMPATSCGPGGFDYEVNLATRSLVTINGGGLCGGGNLASSHDGSTLVFGQNPQGYGGFCTYDAVNNAFHVGDSYRTSASISGDGNVAAAGSMLTDSNANIIGWMAQPPAYYGQMGSSTVNSVPPLLEPQINDSGSLSYTAYPNYIEIADIQHGLLRMRFSLSEVVANTAAPIAIDSSGRHIFLITDKGLTIVDLGTAPLSIGHLSPLIASAGTQVTVRGSGFVTGMSATVGGQAAAINVTDENTLTLVMPALSSGPQDIVLTGADSSYTLENGITVP